ncbi:ABC transporter permease [Clostridium oceanicum]|uniref:ABC-2 family transporter protein n=1 Tax=Clostridium oceanicum TaxID=1543 RepID=A0ABN1JD89_9CLOT
MINYIKSEFYRIFNRSYFKLYVVMVSMLMFIVNQIIKLYPRNEMNLRLVIEGSILISKLVIFLIIPIVYMIILEENKTGTLKNVLAFGLSRNKIFLSKIIVCSMLIFITMFSSLTLFILSGWIMFSKGENISTTMLMGYGLRLLV